MQISIRDFSTCDKETFLKMVTDFYSTPAVAHKVDPKNFETTFNEAINKSPFVRGLIIEDENGVAGYSLLSFTYSNEVGGLVVLIEELYILEECRGNGAASALFEFIETEYPSAKRFKLEVVKDNIKAISLYEKLGYTVISYDQMGKDI